MSTPVETSPRRHNAPDIFALGGRENEPDAELFAAIEAHNRLIEAANNANDEDETSRLCEEARPHRDRVEQYRPATLRGVLAALDFGSEIYDPDYWPEGAIEGLRRLLAFAKTDSFESKSYPIATAPRTVDAPLLLWDKDDCCWFVGYWDGECWCSGDGFIAAPIAWAPLPPAPVASGKHDDTELIDAKQTILALLPAFCAQETADEERTRLYDAIYEQVATINSKPPRTLQGVAVKLWLLASPDIGMEVGERDDDLISLRQVAEFVEHMTGGAS